MSLLDFVLVLFVFGVSTGLTVLLLVLSPIALILQLAWGRDG